MNGCIFVYVWTDVLTVYVYMCISFIFIWCSIIEYVFNICIYI